MEKHLKLKYLQPTIQYDEHQQAVHMYTYVWTSGRPRKELLRSIYNFIRRIER